MSISSRYFSPSSWEVPEEFSRKTSVFGMGASHAGELAKKWSLAKPQGWRIVFGCCGALSPDIRRGECFVIHQVLCEGETWNLDVPKELSHFPQAKLLSVRSPLWSPEEKQKVFKETGAQLVDCEMGFILKDLQDSQVPQLLFVRGVIDEAGDRIDFFTGTRVKWGTVLNPLRPAHGWAFVKFVYSFVVYRSKIQQFLKRMDRLLLFDENTQG